MIDTLGRAFLPDLLRKVLSSAAAATAAPALSSMLIYLFDGDRAGGAAGGAVSGRQAMMFPINARNVVTALVALGLILLAALLGAKRQHLHPDAVHPQS